MLKTNKIKGFIKTDVIFQRKDLTLIQFQKPRINLKRMK